MAIYVTPILLQLYPLTVSFNSNMLTIHSCLSSVPLHLYLAVSAASSDMYLLFVLVHPRWSGSKSNWNWGSLRWHQPDHDSKRFPISLPSRLRPTCGYICFTGRLRHATWCHFWQIPQFYYAHFYNVCSSSYFHIHALLYIRNFCDSETSKTIACLFQFILCQLYSFRRFLSQYLSSSARS